MSKTKKKIETSINPSTHQRLKARAKKNNTTIADVLRDAVKAYVRK